VKKEKADAGRTLGPRRNAVGGGQYTKRAKQGIKECGSQQADQLLGGKKSVSKYKSGKRVYKKEKILNTVAI